MWTYELITIAHLSEPKMCARTVRGLMKIQLMESGEENIGLLRQVSNHNDSKNPLKNWVPKGKIIWMIFTRKVKYETIGGNGFMADYSFILCQQEKMIISVTNYTPKPMIFFSLFSSTTTGLREGKETEHRRRVYCLSQS